MRFTRRIAAMLLPVVILSCSAVFAQAHDPKLDAVFVKTRNERDAAMRSGDSEVYSRYTTKDFWVIMPDGSVQTKQDRIAAMRRSQSAEQLSPPRDEKIDAYGGTVVVSWISAIQGKDARFSETWVKQKNGVWMVAAAHVSMIQAKP